MTGRQRLLSILAGRPTDRLSWTTLVDDKTRSAMAAEFRRLSPLDFYRRIGCDIVQFGNYGLPEELRVPTACRFVGPDVETRHTDGPDGSVKRVTPTEWGTLTSVRRDGHPIEYLVSSVEKLRIFRRLLENSRCQEVGGMEEGVKRVQQAIGDDGIFLHTVNPSAVQQLLRTDMGVENFYVLLNEHRAEVVELLEIMHQRRTQEYEIIARRTPARVIVPVEDTSTTAISPSVYLKYSLPQIRDFCDICHRHGKLAVLHMCGKLKGLLPALHYTGFDGVNGLTPPPVGDVTVEEALDEFGEDFLVLGASFNGDVFQRPDVRPKEISRALERLYTPRVRRARMVLWLGADGVPTPLERFLAVKEWMETNGSLAA